MVHGTTCDIPFVMLKLGMQRRRDMENDKSGETPTLRGLQIELQHAPIRARKEWLWPLPTHEISLTQFRT